MIFSVTGVLQAKEAGRAVIEAGGVGYEIMIPLCVFERLPAAGDEVRLLTVESSSMYSGGTTLYGFLNSEQKDMFCCFKDHVPSTGAKKAIEYLDKAGTSLPDFRRAVIDSDPGPLVGICGFSKKAAEKIIAGLKGKVEALAVTSSAKRSGTAGASTAANEAVEALITLGYRRNQAQQMVGDVDGSVSVQEIINSALKNAVSNR